MSIQVITDSTADIPAGLSAELGIRVIPIYVRFGDKIFRDGIDISDDEFYTRLASSPIHPATSQPNPEDFTGVYREYCDKSDGIVSIHISSRISGTFNSAGLARKTLKSHCPIEIVDSQFNSAGLGLVVLTAARLARAGASFSEVVATAHQAVYSVRMLGMFETMKYLARSGRVNKTIASASEFLHVMPLLTFRRGEIIRAGLVRTVNRGIDRIYDFVARNTPVSELTIVHSAVEDRALHLKERISSLMASKDISIAHLGAGLGVHGGPGVLLAALKRVSGQPAVV